MFLELHDNEPPTLAATARGIDYDYQAEQWVIETSKDRPDVVRWVLFTDDGTPRREWHRQGRDFAEVPVAAGTVADPRSTGGR